MSIPSETVIMTRDVERVATIKLVRVVDFEKVAEENGGSIPLEMLKTAGDFEIVIEPNGRGKDPIRVPTRSQAEGVAYVDGFEACANLKKKGPRTPKTPAAVAKSAKAKAAKATAAKATAPKGKGGK